jgi:hypothetical protein
MRTLGFDVSRQTLRQVVQGAGETMRQQIARDEQSRTVKAAA